MLLWLGWPAERRQAHMAEWLEVFEITDMAHPAKRQQVLQ